MDYFSYLKNAIYNMDYISFLRGAASGMVGMILSYPLDTIKTCVQTKRYIQYNLPFLYKGIGSSLLGIGFEKAIVFGIYNNMMR